MSNKRLMVSLGVGFLTLTMAVWGQRTQPSFSPNPPSPSHFLGHPRLFHPRKLSQIIRDSLPAPLSSPTQAECNRVITQAVYTLSQSWTADNRPFRQARLQIERLYAKMDVPTFMQKVVLPYHRAALKHPTDALTVFRYGYALRLGAFSMVNGFDQFVTLKLLATPKPPYAWDYARMMYLWLGLLPDDGNMGGYIFENYPAVMRAGSKLLRDAPNDRYVADVYAADLVLSNDAQQKTKGLKLARQLTEKYPKTYSPWATIANYYGQRFARHPNKADAEQALEATRNCLLYAPRDPYNNENGAMTTYLQEVIDRYEEWIKTHSK